MNFVKITVKDQELRSLRNEIQSEEDRKVDRVYNVNLALILRYTRANFFNDNCTYSIIFYFSREDYLAWTYNSEAARDEAFEQLEDIIYPELMLDFNSPKKEPESDGFDWPLG